MRLFLLIWNRTSRLPAVPLYKYILADLYVVIKYGGAFRWNHFMREQFRLCHLFLLSAALMYFTGIIDTFSVMLIQVVLIGGGVGGTGITWWMESAYLLSFLVYLLRPILLGRLQNVKLVYKTGKSDCNRPFCAFHSQKIVVSCHLVKRRRFLWYN